MSVPPKKKRLRILVSGRVQGVCFRYYTKTEADRHGLTGYVRNLPDGRVEIEAEGEPGRLEKLEEWARRGPPSARVEEVRVRRIPARERTNGFRITG